MGYECGVERDSCHEDGSNRATTFVITFPRIVLAEFVTHRLNKDTWGELSWCDRTTDESISKNSASSRATPFAKMVEKVNADPFMPFWTANQKGMQGGETDQRQRELADEGWLAARDKIVHIAERLHDVGIHKQDVNRLLEPWMWVTQVVTSSRWDNFFALRCHHAAHPAFRHIARMMFLARRKSVPTKMKFGQWHLPFVSEEEQEKFYWDPFANGPEIPDLIKFSAARCAWISYSNHDKESTPEAMLRTWDRLFAEIPVHASPVEHQLTPFKGEGYISYEQYRSNITGWIQARKLIPHEEIRDYNPSDEEVASWGEFYV